MVDFTKAVGAKASTKAIAPDEIYSRLDRRSDKGPLRPAQESVLNEWHTNRREDKDVILKLHTGQGKTLIGLLMLQSKLNETGQPALYLCPNIQLAQQTLQQAEEFGVKCVQIEKDLPHEFLDGNAILVTHVQKLFNGKTKFGLGNQAQKVGSMVIDDAHACINSIKSSSIIKLPREHKCYQPILDLFDADLLAQGMGTLTDVKSGNYEAFIPVPYWSWHDKREDITRILSRENDSDEIKFAWPLIRDTLHNCLCIISGTELQIIPYNLPISSFGTFSSAQQRIYMSATLNNDSILISGLGLSEQSVQKPITHDKDSWSGEKMVLIPSLIDSYLNQSNTGNIVGKEHPHHKFGTAILVPSTRASVMWSQYGSKVVTRTDIAHEIRSLKNGETTQPRVFVNRYDGIDLPDDSCRILVIDGKPFSEDMYSRYEMSVRGESDIVSTQTAMSIEQGMGRAVRGEKDYCCILLTSSDLVNFVRSSNNRKFFSGQTKKQIEIGITIAGMAKDEIEQGADPEKAFISLINQSLSRDEGWKNYYTEEMNSFSSNLEQGAPDLISIYAAEREAGNDYLLGSFSSAEKKLQTMLDNNPDLPESDKSWYLQEMARLIYPSDKIKSARLQKSAYTRNRYLLKPQEHIPYKRIETLKEKRTHNIIEWVKSFTTNEDMILEIKSITSHLQFSVESDKFEEALKKLGKALGFESERPDKELKEGPDILWAIEDGRYILIEAKNEVLSTRKAINKSEAGQMNTSINWFEREYKGCHVTPIIVIPTEKTDNAAALNPHVIVMKAKSLRAFNLNVLSFFTEISKIDNNNLRPEKVQELFNNHYLDVQSIQSRYATPSQLL
jgi:replicative superfamily II helicase